jgi:CPA2 family monovalent cation:H+ antiporter-2
MATLYDLVILFGLALLTVILLRRFVPTVIGFLLAGIVAGPSGLGLINDTHQIEQLAEVGVILLLFTIGIEFSLSELMRIRQLVFLGGGLQLLLTILIVALLGLVVGLPWNQAVFFGFLAALSSTAILMKLLMDAGELDTPHGKTALGILIFQDLCVVPLMLFTPFLAGAGDGLSGILQTSLKAVAVVLVAHFGARFLVPWIFGQAVKSRSRELFLITIILIGFGTAWLTAMAGLSLALGAFIAGLAISESEYSQQALGDLVPFRDAFMSLFFISIGMLLNPTIFLRQPLLVLALIVALVVIKATIAAGAVLLLGIPARIAIVTGLTLAQIGEFAFVLAQSGQHHQLLTPQHYQLFLAATVATMGLTPVCLRYAPTLAELLVPRLPRALVAGRGRLVERRKKILLSDHVVIVGFGINGKNLARTLKGLKIPHVVIETNPFTVASEKKRGERIIFGDASRPEVLEHAAVASARIVVIAISDAAASRRIAAQVRQFNPTIYVIVRTRYLAEVEPLFRLGANEVIPEEFETSIEILSRVLRKFLIPEEQIDACVAEVRRDGYEMLRSASRRHAHATGISGFLSGAEIGTFTIHKGSILVGSKLRDGLLRSDSGVNLIALRRGEDVVANPEPHLTLHAGDVLLLLGTPEQLRAALPLCEGTEIKEKKGQSGRATPA